MIELNLQEHPLSGRVLLWCLGCVSGSSHDFQLQQRGPLLVHPPHLLIRRTTQNKIRHTVTRPKTRH